MNAKFTSLGKAIGVKFRQGEPVDLAAMLKAVRSLFFFFYRSNILIGTTTIHYANGEWNHHVLESH